MLHRLIFVFALVFSTTIYSQHFAEAKKWMITSQGNDSSKAAYEVIEQGGNIIDAFAALSFAISVERPQSTGIGGGGFLLYFDPKKMKKPTSLDFRETAPFKGHSKMYLDKEGNEIKNKSLIGVSAGGVPGLVHGVLTAHQKWGKLPLKKVMAPAIKMAREGIVVYPGLISAISYMKKHLSKFTDSKKIFLSKEFKVGDRLKQEDLARTLEIIAEKGINGFYEGEIADKIVDSIKSRGGYFSKKDLSSYQTIERPVVEGSYKEFQIFSMGPPSSGGIHVVQILQTLENFEFDYPLSKKTVHLVSSAMQRAFVDRARFLGDADFVDVPIKKLISKDYAKSLSQKINIKRATPSKSLLDKEDLFKESSETTHFTIMDNEGRVVSSTQTINGWFGSTFVIPGTGIVLNNEMDDFATKVGASNLFGAIGGKNNLIEPKKRPLSSMSPTIVMDKKSNKTLMALGTPSGTRILTCVMQTIFNVLEFKLPLLEAVKLPRYHHQWYPDEIRVGTGFPLKLQKELSAMGHKIKGKPLGCRIQAIKLGEKLIGVSDPRGEGLALGL